MTNAKKCFTEIFAVAAMCAALSGCGGGGGGGATGNTPQAPVNFISVSRPENGSRISDVDFQATDTFYIEIVHTEPLAAGSLSVTFKMDNGTSQNITGYFNEVNSTTLRSSALIPFTRSLFNLPSNDTDRVMTVTVSARTDANVSGTATCSFTVYPLTPPSP